MIFGYKVSLALSLSQEATHERFMVWGEYLLLGPLAACA